MVPGDPVQRRRYKQKKTVKQTKGKDIKIYNIKKSVKKHHTCA